MKAESTLRSGHCEEPMKISLVDYLALLQKNSISNSMVWPNSTFIVGIEMKLLKDEQFEAAEKSRASSQAYQISHTAKEHKIISSLRK